MKVRAIGRSTGMVVGIYKNSRVRSGEVFIIDEKDFSKEWMEKVTEDARVEDIAPSAPAVADANKNVLG